MTPLSVIIFFDTACAGFSLGWFFHAALSTDLDAPLERMPVDAMRRFRELWLKIKECHDQSVFTIGQDSVFEPALVKIEVAGHSIASHEEALKFARDLIRLVATINPGVEQKASYSVWTGETLLVGNVSDKDLYFKPLGQVTGGILSFQKNAENEH